VGYHPGSWKQDVGLNNIITPADTNSFHTNTHTETPRDNYGFNASYSKKFKNNPKRTLDILSQYSLNTRTSKYELLRNNIGDETVNYKETNTNKNQNNEFTIQADYVQPLKNPKQKIETGLKYINRDITSDFQLQYWVPGMTDFVMDPIRTDKLDYTQQVGAAYAQFSTPLTQKLSMIAGARYEFTDIKGHQNEANSAFGSQFNNVLPNVSLAYTTKNFSKLKLSYNMRIERPSIEYINPYVNTSDQYNWKQGNPLLVPEKTHNVELGYSTFFNNVNLNFSSFYRHTGNAIESVTVVGTENRSYTTYQNIAKNNTIGLDFFGSGTFFKNWMVNLNGSLYYKMLKSPSLKIENNGLQYNASLYTSYKLNEKFSLAGFAMYNGNQVQLQGSQDGWYYYFLGVQMNVLKTKGTISLSGENFFTPEIYMTTRYTYQNAEYVNKTTYFGRGLRLTFNWSFGKMSYSQKKKIDNDDLKSGGDGQQGMGGR
jgi:outer membrane receptor protein involved in Fe transport